MQCTARLEEGIRVERGRALERLDAPFLAGEDCNYFIVIVWRNQIPVSTDPYFSVTRKIPKFLLSDETNLGRINGNLVALRNN